MLINIEDRLKLSPPGFEAALKECFQLLPFKIQKPVRVTVQASPGQGWPRRKLSLGFGDAWLITLYAAHIDADVQRSRLYYWLLITLDELAHLGAVTTSVKRWHRIQSYSTERTGTAAVS